jgi:hypothetical protein
MLIADRASSVTQYKAALHVMCHSLVVNKHAALTSNSGMPHFETMLLRSMIIWLLSTAYAICCTPKTSLQQQQQAVSTVCTLKLHSTLVCCTSGLQQLWDLGTILRVMPYMMEGMKLAYNDSAVHR